MSAFGARNPNERSGSARVASAITDAEAGHLNWDTRARAALDAADYGKVRVYVAERGVYAESYVAGVWARHGRRRKRLRLRPRHVATRLRFSSERI